MLLEQEGTSIFLLFSMEESLGLVQSSRDRVALDHGIAKGNPCPRILEGKLAQS